MNIQQPITMSNEQINQGCVISSDNELRHILHISSFGSRVLPSPTVISYNQREYYRTVELDVYSAGLTVTYVFLCKVYGDGTIISSPLGHK